MRFLAMLGRQAHAYFLLLLGIWILFLSLVIRRLVTLISTQATLLAQAEVSMKQATTAARSLFEQKAKSSDAEEVKSEAAEEHTYVSMVFCFFRGLMSVGGWTIPIWKTRKTK